MRFTYKLINFLNSPIISKLSQAMAEIKERDRAKKYPISLSELFINTTLVQLFMVELYFMTKISYFYSKGNFCVFDVATKFICVMCFARIIVLLVITKIVGYLILEWRNHSHMLSEVIRKRCSISILRTYRLVAHFHICLKLYNKSVCMVLPHVKSNWASFLTLWQRPQLANHNEKQISKY